MLWAFREALSLIKTAGRGLHLASASFHAVILSSRLCCKRRRRVLDIEINRYIRGTGGSGGNGVTLGGSGGLGAGASMTNHINTSSLTMNNWTIGLTLDDPTSLLADFLNIEKKSTGATGSATIPSLLEEMCKHKEELKCARLGRIQSPSQSTSSSNIALDNDHSLRSTDTARNNNRITVVPEYLGIPFIEGALRIATTEQRYKKTSGTAASGPNFHKWPTFSVQAVVNVVWNQPRVTIPDCKLAMLKSTPKKKISLSIAQMIMIALTEIGVPVNTFIFDFRAY
ncbi:hypothetical protein R3P38DRAFT_2792028 [Favolaschia claudopus]|uniref:Uncharacterized protein n=1 Tax=Favolaschia claudopus TaxID=2862362 RepID=A0AAW0AEV0_9AGAR